MNLVDIGRILLGLVLLVAGGEMLVRGAAGLAARIGMSPLVVGLTVVAFATSARCCAESPVLRSATWWAAT